jgi:hypothetical protein
MDGLYRVLWLPIGYYSIEYIINAHKCGTISPAELLCGTISPAELKKLRRCGSFDLSGPIIYQRF